MLNDIVVSGQCPTDEFKAYRSLSVTSAQPRWSHTWCWSRLAYYIGYTTLLLPYISQDSFQFEARRAGGCIQRVHCAVSGGRDTPPQRPEEVAALDCWNVPASSQHATKIT